MLPRKGQKNWVEQTDSEIKQTHLQLYYVSSKLIAKSPKSPSIDGKQEAKMSIDNNENKVSSIDKEIDEFTKQEIERYEEKKRNQEYPDYVYIEGIDHGESHVD